MSIAFGSSEAATVRAADQAVSLENVTYKTALLATCRMCGGVVGIRTNTPEHARDAARDVAEWIRAGLRVCDLPVPEAKAALSRWCECGRLETGAIPLELKEA